MENTSTIVFIVKSGTSLRWTIHFPKRRYSYYPLQKQTSVVSHHRQCKTFDSQPRLRAGHLVLVTDATDSARSATEISHAYDAAVRRRANICDLSPNEPRTLVKHASNSPHVVKSKSGACRSRQLLRIQPHPLFGTRSTTMETESRRRPSRTIH
jgi:hypothetical protein